MSEVIGRFGGLVLAAVAVVAGVLMGRVIEAVAVAAVLFAAWTYVRRLASSADDAIGDSDGRTR